MITTSSIGEMNKIRRCNFCKGTLINCREVWHEDNVYHKDCLEVVKKQKKESK